MQLAQQLSDTTDRDHKIEKFNNQCRIDYEWSEFIANNVVNWDWKTNINHNLVQYCQSANSVFIEPHLSVRWSNISRGMKERGKTLLKNLDFRVEDDDPNIIKIKLPLSRSRNDIADDLTDTMTEINDMKKEQKIVAREARQASTLAVEAKTEIATLQEDIKSNESMKDDKNAKNRKNRHCTII